MERIPIGIRSVGFPCAHHDDDVDDDDIYIMMKCLSVTKNDHFRAERRRREVSRPLDLAGHRPALAK